MCGSGTPKAGLEVENILEHCPRYGTFENIAPIAPASGVSPHLKCGAHFEAILGNFSGHADGERRGLDRVGG